MQLMLIKTCALPFSEEIYLHTSCIHVFAQKTLSLSFVRKRQAFRCHGEKSTGGHSLVLFAAVCRHLVNIFICPVLWLMTKYVQSDIPSTSAQFSYFLILYTFIPLQLKWKYLTFSSITFI